MNNLTEVRKYKICRVVTPSGFKTYVDELTRMVIKFGQTSGSPTMALELFKKVIHGLNETKDWGFWIVTDEYAILPYGYCAAQVVVNDGNRECFIWQVYLESPGMFDRGFEAVKDWAKKQGCSKVYFMTRRNPHAYQRKMKKHGFAIESVMISAPI